MKLVVTKQFDRAVKAIKKKHDPVLKATLIDKIRKIYNQLLDESDRAHNLKGKHTNGLQDVHISGDLIILYRYDEDSDSLVLSAKLHNIVNHNELHEKDTFKEKQGFEKDIEEYIREIESSTDIADDITFEYVDDWFTDYYNDCIFKVSCIDDIEITSIVDKGDRLLLLAEGYQYIDTCPPDQFDIISEDVRTMCRSTGTDCRLTGLFDIRDNYNDPTSYKIKMILLVPLVVDK